MTLPSPVRLRLAAGLVRRASRIYAVCHLPSFALVPLSRAAARRMLRVQRMCGAATVAAEMDGDTLYLGEPLMIPLRP
jgi:hypothetical protein